MDDTGLRPWNLGEFVRGLLHALFTKFMRWDGGNTDLIELGCGIRPCAKPGPKVVVSDYNANVIQRLQEKYNHALVLDWSKGLEADQEWLRNRFDLVLACEVLYYAVDERDLLGMAKCLLKPETGIMLLVSYLRTIQAESLCTIGEELGLVIRVLDIHRINEELLDGNFDVSGYCICASIHHKALNMEDQNNMLSKAGLMEYEIGIDELVDSDSDEDPFRNLNL